MKTLEKQIREIIKNAPVWQIGTDEMVMSEKKIDELVPIILSLIKSIVPKEKAFGGYDGEEIVNDKEAFGYNTAIWEIINKIEGKKDC
jgi:hypothetical protein